MKSATDVNNIKNKPDLHKISQISGKEANKSDIAPHIADIGKARNMPRTNRAKVFENAIASLLNITMLAAARAK